MILSRELAARVFLNVLVKCGAWSAVFSAKQVHASSQLQRTKNTIMNAQFLCFY